MYSLLGGTGGTYGGFRSWLDVKKGLLGGNGDIKKGIIEN